jgi:hypothetical protein
MAKDFKDMYKKELDIVIQLKDQDTEKLKQAQREENSAIQSARLRYDDNENQQRAYKRGRELALLKESQAMADAKKQQTIRDKENEIEQIKSNIQRAEELEIIQAQEVRSKRMNELEGLHKNLSQCQVYKKARELEEKANEKEFVKGQDDFLKKFELESQSTTTRVKNSLIKNEGINVVFSKIYNDENEKKKKLEFLMIDKPYQDKIIDNIQRENNEAARSKAVRDENNMYLKSQIDKNQAQKDHEYIERLQSEYDLLLGELNRLDSIESLKNTVKQKALREYLDSIKAQINDRKIFGVNGDTMNIHEAKLNHVYFENEDYMANPDTFPGNCVQHDRTKQLQIIDRNLKSDDYYLKSFTQSKDINQHTKLSNSRRSLIFKPDASSKLLISGKENGLERSGNYNSDYEFIRFKDKNKNYDIITHILKH